MSKRYWTEDKLDWLRQRCTGTPLSQLCDMYNKEFNANIKTRAFLGACSRYGIKNGIDCTFKKGMIPKNKGKRQEEYMSPEAIAKTIKGRFKQQSGHQIGEVYAKMKHGKLQTFIKLGYSQNQEMLYARYVYEQYYNIKLKPEEKIIHLDGDYTNCDIDNLILIDNADHLRIISSLPTNAIGGYIENNPQLNKAMIVTTKLDGIIRKKENRNVN